MPEYDLDERAVVFQPTKGSSMTRLMAGTLALPADPFRSGSCSAGVATRIPNDPVAGGPPQKGASRTGGPRTPSSRRS